MRSFIKNGISGMNGCFSMEDSILGCTCNCHGAKNNLSCLNCKCRPAHNSDKLFEHIFSVGDSVDKVQTKLGFLESTLDKIVREHFNIVGRLNNVAKDMKDACIRIRDLEEMTTCSKCKGKGKI